MCKQCFISDSLETLLFDHKSIKLFLGMLKKSNRNFINNQIFSHPRFEAVVATTAAETYLHHAVPGQPGLDLAEGLQHVGRLVQLIRDANDIEFELSFNEKCSRKEHMLSGLNTEISIEVENLLDPDLLNDISLTCTPRYFSGSINGKYTQYNC
jgi:hypothetical protein